MSEAMLEAVERGKNSLIGNYARLPVVMARGEGSFLWDEAGKQYLDLFAGFGGGILGHCHPDLVAAATDQAKQLWHVGNTFYTVPQIEFAERLAKTAFPGRAFFCHSGGSQRSRLQARPATAGGAASPAKWKIISLTRSFHGRTLAMISATGNPAVKAGFEPVVPGFIQVEAGDFAALESAVDEETAGILMEPIQGEGGIHLYPEDYARQVRKLCDDKGLTLIFDEVWTGCGRTGKWFAHQHFADETGGVVVPDIMTLGKAVGGGLPVGVMWTNPELASLLVPGKHGSTLGGNPICMAVARAIFDVIERENLLGHATVLGEHAVARLKNEASIRHKVTAIRGKGLFLGIELKDAPEKLVEKGLEKGIAVNLTAKNVIRLAPPINIERQDWDRGLDAVVALIASL